MVGYLVAENEAAGLANDLCTVCAADWSVALLCRGGERGTARPEVLQSLLKTTERVVQEIDSVEYGLTDIQVHLCCPISRSLHEVSSLVAAAGHMRQ